jgi:hypothetical protein
MSGMPSWFWMEADDLARELRRRFSRRYRQAAPTH